MAIRGLFHVFCQPGVKTVKWVWTHLSTVMCDYCVKVEFDGNRVEIPKHHIEDHNLENRDLIGIVPFHQDDGEMGGGHVTIFRHGEASFRTWKQEKYGYGDSGWVLIHPIGEDYE